MGRKRRLSTPHKANNTEKEKARNAKELENELAKREREMVEPDVHIEEEEKDEVGEARFRFYGALKGLTEKKPEDSESESSLFDDEEHDEEDMFSDSQINFVQDRVRHELGKKYHDKDNGSYGFTSSNKFLSGLDSDRDDPKGDNPALSTKQSYVMKLFDRSVDLAQFDDVTPLYPICRSWVANQPKKPWEKKKEAPPAPSWAIKEETEEEEEEGPVSKKKTKEDGGTEEENGEVDTSDIEPSQIELKVIAKLPPPSYYVDLNAPSIRIPPPLPKVIEPLLSDEAKPAEELLPSQEELLGGHLTRWLQIKTSWLHASQKNEERYLKSRQLLQLMYNRTMKQAQ